MPVTKIMLGLLEIFILLHLIIKSGRFVAVAGGSIAFYPFHFSFLLARKLIFACHYTEARGDWLDGYACMIATTQQ